MSFSNEEEDLWEQEGTEEFLTSTPDGRVHIKITSSPRSQVVWESGNEDFLPRSGNEVANGLTFNEELDFRSVGEADDIFQPLETSEVAELSQSSADQEGDSSFSDFFLERSEFPLENSPPVFNDDQFPRDEVEHFDHRLAVKFNLIEKLYWHDILLQLRILLSKSDTSGLSLSLRAARNAAWLPKHLVEVGRVIGEGTFGKAYLTKATNGKRYVLKKEIISPFHFSMDFKRIIREKNSMMIAAQHPNLIHIKGSWVLTAFTGFVVYTTMEFADFGRLQDYVERSRMGLLKGVSDLSEPSLNSERIRSVLKQIRAVEKDDQRYERGFRHIIVRFAKEFISAIFFLHSHGISHNDLHEENILIGKGFHIKIADFGLATINHPLYECEVLAGNRLSDSLELGMSHFQWSQNVGNDHGRTLIFLQYIATGITSNLISFVVVDDQPTIAIDPNYKEILFYDHFLSHYSNVIVTLAKQSPTDPWVRQIEEELTIFSNKYGGPYQQHDPREFILELYGRENFNSRLESNLDIGTQRQVFTEGDSGEQFYHLAGIGYLDESFMQEIEERLDAD